MLDTVSPTSLVSTKPDQAHVALINMMDPGEIAELKAQLLLLAGAGAARPADHTLLGTALILFTTPPGEDHGGDDE
jgi:hypothetical protein